MVFFLLLFFSGFGSALAAAPDCPDLEKRLDSLFRWGEFDSLLHWAPPPEDSRSRREDCPLPRLHLYRGVALAAKGEKARARAEFESALARDSSLDLDGFYASPSIQLLFSEVKGEALPPSPALTSPASLSFAPPPAPSRRPLPAPFWIASLGGLALLGGAFFALEESEAAYGEYRRAAERGDRESFRIGRQRVQLYDGLTWGLGTGALGAWSLGGFLGWKTVQRRSPRGGP